MALAMQTQRLPPMAACSVHVPAAMTHSSRGDCAMQKCPFDAIMIINLPKDLSSHTTHRYGPNSFKLHRFVQRISVACMRSVSPPGHRAALQQREEPSTMHVAIFRGSSASMRPTAAAEVCCRCVMPP
jgi:hypothetical protein